MLSSSSNTFNSRVTRIAAGERRQRTYSSALLLAPALPPQQEPRWLPARLQLAPRSGTPAPGRTHGRTAAGHISSLQASVKLRFCARSSIATHNTPQRIVLPHFSRMFSCLCKLFAPTTSQSSEPSCLTPDRVKCLTCSESADCSFPVTPFTYFMQQNNSLFISPPDFKRPQSFPLASLTHLPSPVIAQQSSTCRSRKLTQPLQVSSIFMSTQHADYTAQSQS